MLICSTLGTIPLPNVHGQHDIFIFSANGNAPLGHVTTPTSVTNTSVTSDVIENGGWRLHLGSGSEVKTLSEHIYNLNATTYVIWSKLVQPFLRYYKLYWIQDGGCRRHLWIRFKGQLFNCTYYPKNIYIKTR